MNKISEHWCPLYDAAWPTISLVPRFRTHGQIFVEQGALRAVIQGGNSFQHTAGEMSTHGSVFVYRSKDDFKLLSVVRKSVVFEAGLRRRQMSDHTAQHGLRYGAVEGSCGIASIRTLQVRGRSPFFFFRCRTSCYPTGWEGSHLAVPQMVTIP